MARFEQELRSVWRRAGVPPHSVRRVSFGHVTVLDITVVARRR